MATTDIITGQHVRIAQTAASIGDRIIARLIDYIAIGCYALSMSYLLFATGLVEATPLWSLAIAIPAFFYSVLCEILFHGQTLGKAIRKMRVVNIDGSPPTIGGVLLRWMGLIIDVWMSCAGILVIMATPRRQRLGDLAAGTMVIRMDEYAKWHGALDDFYHLRPDYRPTYREASNLSDAQANIIERTLFAPEGYDETKVDTLATKVSAFLHVVPREKDKAGFLLNVLHDYQYFELTEI